jgi:ubiquitin fusion degradation protein 1
VSAGSESKEKALRERRSRRCPKGASSGARGACCLLVSVRYIHRHNTNRKPRVVTADTHLDGRRVPAALNIPFGHLFFGYPHVPLKKAEDDQGTGDVNAATSQAEVRFTGGGATLSGRSRSRDVSSPNGSNSGSTQEKKEARPTTSFAGKGNALSERDRDVIVIDDD